MLRYIDEHPSLAGYVRVPCRQAMPNFDAVADAKPRRCLPSVLRWITRGRWPTRDCVAVAARMLRDAGHLTPNRLISPIQLKRWLEAQGYAYEETQ